MKNNTQYTLRIVRGIIAFTILLVTDLTHVRAQSFSLSGHIVDEKKKPIEFANVLIRETGLWATTDNKGAFTIKKVTEGHAVLSVQCLGYAPSDISVEITKDIPNLIITLKEENLKLDEVQVVARRSDHSSTRAYTIDRQVLDNQQIINIANITSLLPGGKVANPSLVSDPRVALHAGSSEAGNAAFGTAVDVDGFRLSNNAAAGETTSASTRMLPAANVESVEIVTGIPSVEYSDLSNGIVKIKTRRGVQPFVIEGSVNQHTRQVAVNKGFAIGRNGGVLNASLEHARSFADAASPHTAYQRNVLSLNYMNTWMKHTAPLTLNVGLRGNVGGYNAQADPDNNLDDYDKTRDNAFSANASLNWQPHSRWITQLQLSAGLSVSDRRSTGYHLTHSASTQAYIHATAQGYHISEDYDTRPDADIILSPTGYWYLKSFSDSKPFSATAKLRYEWVRNGRWLTNTLMAGAEYSYDHNGGKGVYYDDMRYAPTWRPYEYRDLPGMSNVGLFAENRTILHTGRHASLYVNAGLREDITLVPGSDYGTVSSLSPRFNLKYSFIEHGHGFVTGLSLYAGWGKSVKLPSFQVLYPRPAYSDRLVFSSTSDAANRSYTAYYTFPTAAVYNKDLKWQHARQWDMGVQLDTRIFSLSLSAFYTRTLDPYMATTVFTPYSYNYTSQTALQQAMRADNIPVANRVYSINSQGIVTVSDRTEAMPAVALATEQRNTYVANTKYVNGSPLSRWGIDWIVDFRQIQALRTQIRLDGNYYHYKSLNATTFADVLLGISSRMTDGRPYQYIGYYVSGNATSTGYDATASVSNGAISKQANLNVTFTTHIPRIRLIMALRVETSLYTWRRAMSRYSNGASRGYALANSADVTGQPYDGKSTDQTVIVYPESYSTWENPDERIPYLERLLWAKDHDANLYNDLSQLAVRSNYSYTLNPNRVSAYYSANFSVTKEIGDHISISFYANNFFNNMSKVCSTQTGLYTALFGSSYLPDFYYGLSLRLKL